MGSRCWMAKSTICCETGQLGYQVGEQRSPSPGKSPLNDEVLALHPAELVQPLPECVEGWALESAAATP